MSTRTTCERFSIPAACLLAVAMLLLGGVAHAKKPEKPPPAPAAEGWVYFADKYGPGLWRIDADGSNAVQMGLALPDWTDSTSIQRDFAVSHGAYATATLAADYWVFHFKATSATYLDGTPVREIWASRTDGTRTVRLVADDTIHFGPQARIAVAPGDDRIAFNCIDADGSTSPTSAGIYEVDLTWTGGEPVAGSTKTLLLPIEMRVSPQDRFVAPLTDLDWSGDGTQLTAGRNPVAGQGVYVTVITPGVGGGVEDVLMEGSAPQWSPTADLILFTDGLVTSGVESIQSDGTGYELLVAPESSRNSSTYAGPARWAADGLQFAFTQYAQSRKGTTATLAIYDLASGAVTDTEQDVPAPILVAWRPALSQ